MMIFCCIARLWIIDRFRTRTKAKLNIRPKTFAGFRTFAISSLLGTLCFLFNLEIGITGAILIGAISIASLKINLMILCDD